MSDVVPAGGRSSPRVAGLLLRGDVDAELLKEIGPSALMLESSIVLAQAGADMVREAARMRQDATAAHFRALETAEKNTLERLEVAAKAAEAIVSARVATAEAQALAATAEDAVGRYEELQKEVPEIARAIPALTKLGMMMYLKKKGHTPGEWAELLVTSLGPENAAVFVAELGDAVLKRAEAEERQAAAAAAAAAEAKGPAAGVRRGMDAAMDEGAGG